MTTKDTKSTKRRMDLDDLFKRAVGCAIEVHRELGSGLLESTLEQRLAHELALNRISFQRITHFVLFVSFVVV